MRTKLLSLAGAAILSTYSVFAPVDVSAQSGRADASVRRIPGGFSLVYGGMNRAVLGVILANASRSDTLGVRIDDVNPDGPAARAGIKSGMIIAAINDVSLRISGDDAADSELLGLSQRRLTRTLQKANPGDEVELRVLDGGQTRTVRVKTVAASELASEPLRGVMAKVNAGGNRAAVGMSIGVSGSVRDTLGLFVNSVSTGGPAEKAGIVEGDRIASINGIDLRVPKVDVEDMPARMARVTRFNREMQKLTAGDRVTLQVSSSGRTREVTVPTVRASELPDRGFQMHMGEGQFFWGSPAGAPMHKMLEELRTNLRELPLRIRTDVEPRVYLDGVPRGRIETAVPARAPLIRRSASI